MDEATRTMIANLEAKTGVTVAEWTNRISKSGKAKHGELVAWLKGEHGLTHGYANLLVHLAKGSAAETSGASDDALVEAMFAGAKAAMRPAYDAVIAAAQKLGDDVELAPKKAYMSLRRSKQWGLVQPSTATRLDVGLVLKGKPTTARLEASGSFNAMVTHRVRITSAAEVDEELVAWLREAYQNG
jgi:hypothetical protein